MSCDLIVKLLFRVAESVLIINCLLAFMTTTLTE